MGRRKTQMGRRKTQMGSDGKHVWEKYLLECLGRDEKEILKHISIRRMGGPKPD